MSSSDNFLKVGSCDAGGATKTLTVNTNSDVVKNDQFLSLREALLKTQQEPGCWNIIFKKSGSSQYPPYKSGDPDDLGLGYWTIRLTDSLPAISRSNIRINYDDPKTITLIPRNFKQVGQNREYQLKNLSGNRGSGSMLNVGEMNIKLLENKNNNLSAVGDPQVAINKFNFINNTAQGGSGGSGGGGGFGAGGGISVFSGKLKVENSVFQNLGAKGGPSINKTCGAGTGAGFKDIGYFKATDAQSGQRGTVGGLFSAGIGSAGAGGRGGNGGIRVYGKHHGDDGYAGGKGQYGSGGGGGGGGGGRSFYKWDWLGNVEHKYKGYTGHGGPGGRGGAYAGNGAGGVMRCPGGPAQNGSARGGAIAVHDIHTANNTPNAELFLSNVNLVGNNTISGHTTDSADIWLAGSKNTAWFDNVKYASAHSQELVNWQKIKREVVSGGIAKDLSIDPVEKPFNFGYSSPINPKQAKRSVEWDIINFTKNIHDSAIVRFEQPSSGLKNISGDFSDLKRVTDELWKEQLPDKEDEILKKYNSQILQSGKGAGKSLASGLFSANTLNKLATLGKFNPYMAVGGAIIKAGAGFAFEAYEAKQKRDEALEINKQNQEKLQQKLQQSIDIEFSPIDVRETRSAVVIDNFILGEDEVKFQGLPAGNIKAEEGKSTSDGRFTVEIKATPINSNNAPTKIAELRLDPTSVNNLGKNSLENYILKLIHKTDNSGEMILGGYSEAQFSKDKNFDMAGPANTPVIVDRSGSDEYWTEDWRITTSRGNDQIYATDGKEKISTEDGDDIILPGFGQDTVDAGMGFDWVHYRSGPISVKAIEDSAGKISVEAKNRLHYIENAAVTANQANNLSITGSNVSQNGLNITINFSKNLSNKTPKEGQFSILSDDKHISIKSLSIEGSALLIELEEAISDEKDFYLSYVKPSNLNDAYSIQNESEADIDGFTLTNSINQNEWKSERRLTSTNLSTTIKNAEKFSLPSGSIADFSAFKNNFISNIRNGVTLETSVGSNIEGTEYDDLIAISFQDGEINPNLLKSCSNTIVNGGQGSDILKIKLPEEVTFKNRADNSVIGKGEVDIYLPNNVTTSITYEGIEKFEHEGGNPHTTSVDTSSACLNNNNQPTTKIAYAGLNQKLSSAENSENKQLNGRTNEIASMGRITTPPKRLDKKTYLFNDIKVVVGTDDDKNSNAVHVRLDKTQTIKNFNSEVDTIILPEGTDISNVAITGKTIYFNQKAIASFKGSVKPSYLQNDVIDDSGLAEKLYSRESGEKLLFYVYDGDKSNVNLKRQGGDVSLHVKAPNKRLNQWYDSFINTLDHHIEADFARTSNPRKADLKIYSATGKNLKGKNNTGIEFYETIFGLADPTRLVKGKGVDIVIPMDSVQKGSNWSNSWNQSENIHSSLQDIGRALGLRQPMGNANSILFNTNDTVMSDVKTKDGHTRFFTRNDINALKDIWMDEGSHGKEKPIYNLFVPDTTSKDIDFRLKGKGINSGLGQTDETETAVGTFKLKGSQFKNVPRGWIAANSSLHDVSLGFDSNKNGVAEPDEAFAIFSIDQTNDPIRGDRHMQKIFDQLSNPKHQGLLSIQPSRLHFDPDHVGNKSGNSESDQPEVIPFFVFKHSEQFKNNDFAIDVKFNGIHLSEMKIPSTIASSSTIKPSKDMEYGDSYNYLLDQITESALLG